MEFISKVVDLFTSNNNEITGLFIMLLYVLINQQFSIKSKIDRVNNEVSVLKEKMAHYEKDVHDLETFQANINTSMQQLYHWNNGKIYTLSHK